MLVTAKGAIERFGDRLVFVVERLLALGLIAAIVLDFVNVAGRYTGGFTLLGVDEIEIDVLVWVAFIGAVAVTWRGRHLRMDVLYHACPPVLRRIVAAGEMAVMLAVTGFAVFESFTYVENLYALGMVSDIMRIPEWIPHLAVGLCFAAMALIVIVRGAQRFAEAGGDAP
jgi:TRAP-type C4-dicarboxylate transport system permease small subunit